MDLVRNERPIIEAGLIVDSKLAAAADEVIDASGQYLLPGFIDAHVHFRLTSLNFARLAPGLSGDVVISPLNPLERIADLARADAVTQVIERGVPVSPPAPLRTPMPA